MFTITAKNLGDYLEQVSHLNTKDGKLQKGLPLHVCFAMPWDHRAAMFLDDENPAAVFSHCLKEMIALVSNAILLQDSDYDNGFVYDLPDGFLTLVRTDGGTLQAVYHLDTYAADNHILIYLLAHEFLCALSKVPPGACHLISSNATVRKNKEQRSFTMIPEAKLPDGRFPMIDEIMLETPEFWFQDAELYYEDDVVLGLKERFFKRVAYPIKQVSTEKNAGVICEVMQTQFVA